MSATQPQLSWMAMGLSLGAAGLMALGCAKGRTPPEPTPMVQVMGPDGTAAEYTYSVGSAEACVGGQLGDHCTGKPPVVYPTLNVRLTGFEIDSHEVTNLQYLHCVEKGGCSEPAFVDAGSIDKYYEDKDGVFDEHPVVNVSFEQAKEYCAFVGKRLPSEWEWERVARGLPNNQGQRWEYAVDGDKLDDCVGKSIAIEVCQDDVSSPEAVRASVDDVRLEGGLDIHGMSGNVSEWVDAIYVEDITCKCPISSNFQTCSETDTTSGDCTKEVACQDAFNACAGLDGQAWSNCASGIKACDDCLVDGCTCADSEAICPECVKPECHGRCNDSSKFGDNFWVCESYGETAVQPQCIGGPDRCTQNASAADSTCTDAVIPGGDRVYRGAAYNTKDLCLARTTHRTGNQLDKNKTKDFVGFRCARDL